MTVSMDRVALVVGATRGIGRAVVDQLAERGFRLFVTARDKNALVELVTELETVGTSARAIAGDMRTSSAVESVAAEVNADGEGLDVLVYAAGVGAAGPIEGFSDKLFDLQVDVNLRAPLHLSALCLPALREAAARRPASGAKLIALSSLTGLVAEPDLATYGATKAALISLCESISIAHSHEGISATAISPGYVDTDMAAWVHDRIAPESMIPADDVARVVGLIADCSANTVIPHVPMVRAGPELWRA